MKRKKSEGEIERRDNYGSYSCMREIEGDGFVTVLFATLLAGSAARASNFISISMLVDATGLSGATCARYYGIIARCLANYTTLLLYHYIQHAPKGCGESKFWWEIAKRSTALKSPVIFHNQIHLFILLPTDFYIYYYYYCLKLFILYSTLHRNKFFWARKIFHLK